MKYFVICLLLIFVILFIIVEPLLKKNINKKASVLLLSNQYDEIDKLLQKKYVRYVLDPFEYDYVVYSKQIVIRNDEKVLEMTETFLKKNISKKRKVAVLKNSFEYGISCESEPITSYCYNKLKGFLSEEQMIDYDIPYNIYIEKGSKYLDNYLEEYDAADDQHKAILAVVIAVMYHNLKEYGKEKQYKEVYQKSIIKGD